MFGREKKKLFTSTDEPDFSATVGPGGRWIVTALPFESSPVIGTLNAGGELRCGSGVWNVCASAGSGPQPSTGVADGATEIPAVAITRVCGRELSYVAVSRTFCPCATGKPCDDSVPLIAI